MDRGPPTAGPRDRGPLTLTVALPALPARVTGCKGVAAHHAAPVLSGRAVSSAPIEGTLPVSVYPPRAPSRSAHTSSTWSMPTESRSTPSVTPDACQASAGSPRWEVAAG